MSANKYELSQQICFSFYSVNRLFNKFYQQALNDFQLTYTQYLVLVSLWEKEQLSLRDLCTELGLASNTLTPLLKRLEEKNLIVREVPAENKRILLVSLTTQGKNLHNEVEKSLMSCFTQLQILDKEKVEHIVANNNELIAALTKFTEEKK